MSLINDALRKAQTQQRPNPAQTPQVPAQAVQPKQNVLHLVLGFGVVSTVLSMAVALVLYLVFVNYRVELALGPTKGAQPEKIELAPVTAGTEAESGTSREVLETAASAVGQPLAEGQERPQGGPLEEGKPPLENAQASALPAPIVNAESSADLQEWVNGLEVRGVMTGAGKVLLFLPDEDLTAAFSTGEAVDKRGRLSLAEILPNRLIFKDNGGHEYIRRF